MRSCTAVAPAAATTTTVVVSPAATTTTIAAVSDYLESTSPVSGL